MFDGKRVKIGRKRLTNVNKQLVRLNKLAIQIDNHQVNNDKINPYVIIEQVEMLSYSVIYLAPGKTTTEDYLLNNLGENVFQLVILTLLSLHAKRSPTLQKIYDVIAGYYPVAHLDSVFEFKNDVLNLQRLQLMDRLKGVLTPEIVRKDVYEYVLTKIRDYAMLKIK